ncbi:hypothetical protein BGZ65_001177, partial [Modicella reniformis]
KPREPPNLNDDSWTHSYLFQANDPMKQLSSISQYSARKMWENEGVVTSKPTDAHRSDGARHAPEAGADTEAIAQHENWDHRRVDTHYLSRIPSEVALCRMSA